MIESLPEAMMVLVTSESDEQAKKIATSLLEKHLAACVNIIPGATSMYWWEGKIETTAEFVLMIKTREDLLGKLTTEIKSIHGYTVPEIIAFRIEGGNPDYLKWIIDETGSTQ